MMLLAGRLRYLMWLVRAPRLRGGHSFQVGSHSAIKVSSQGRLKRRNGLIFRRGLTLVLDGPMTCGSNVFFNCYAYVSVKQALVIGDGVRFGERVSIHDADHRFEPLPLDVSEVEAYDCSAISIGNRVWVGANSIILRGASIGDDAVIAAGSVVRGKIPSGVLVAGAPARVIRPLAREEIASDISCNVD